MEETFSLTDFEGELLAKMEQPQTGLAEETPFQVLLLGDWSGRKNRGLHVSSAELAGWHPRIVDRDNLDQVMAGLGVRLQIPLASVLNSGSDSPTINFNQLDDFHPDQIFSRLEIFEALGRTRANLNNLKSFQQAAAEVRGWKQLAANESVRPEPVSPKSEDPPPRPAPYSEGSLLDQILSAGTDADPIKTSGQKAAEVSPETLELAKSAVKDYLVPDLGPERDQLIAAVDARVAEIMRAILHHPDFQALESSWRALDFLVTRLDTGSQLRIYLLDVSFEEFRADLRLDQDFRKTAMYKLLVEKTVGTSGGIPWAVIAGNYTFDFEGGDPGLIEPISKIAREAGAPFVGGATAHLLGCESLFETPDPDDWQATLDPQIEERWRNVTNLLSAGYVGLALPRFLLRLPYGRNTEPTEAFAFEEIPDSNDPPVARQRHHESYLWANPAFAVAFLLARGFGEGGWKFRPSDSLSIEGLPLHICKTDDGETTIKPCAEVLLTVRAAEKIIDRGLMPLLSMKESDTVCLGMVQSIAGTQLAGPWD